MERYVKVFEAKESKEASMIELSCLKEALENNLILYQIVYMCYFDDSSHSSCLYLERPRDPKVCRHLLCVKWLKRLGESPQPDLHSLEGVIEPDIEVYVPKKHVPQVRNKILPVVYAKAEMMKAVAKGLGLISNELVPQLIE